MTTETLTLAAFLEARIAEDEAVARHRDVVTFGATQRAIAGVQGVFDPARVLATCKAHRAIVESGPSECGGYADQDSFGWKHYPDPEWGHCDGCSAAESCDADWKRNLKHLASIYADHADFREEWAL